MSQAPAVTPVTPVTPLPDIERQPRKYIERDTVTCAFGSRTAPPCRWTTHFRLTPGRSPSIRKRRNWRNRRNLVMCEAETGIHIGGAFKAWPGHFARQKPTRGTVAVCIAAKCPHLFCGDTVRSAPRRDVAMPRRGDKQLSVR